MIPVTASLVNKTICHLYSQRNYSKQNIIPTKCPGALLCGTRNTRNGIRGTMRRKQNGDAHGIDDCSLDRPDKRSLRGRLCRITSV